MKQRKRLLHIQWVIGMVSKEIRNQLMILIKNLTGVINEYGRDGDMNSINFKCEYCGKESFRDYRLFKRSNYHYCSQDCARKSHKGKTITKEHRRKISNALKGNKHFLGH